MKTKTRLSEWVEVLSEGSFVYLAVGGITIQLTVNEAREIAAMLEAVARTAESGRE